MEIKNIEGLSGDEIRSLVSRGGKFIMYEYCISIVFMTFKRPSAIYFIRPDESKITPSIGMTLVSFFLGWWGIPWGPIYTIGAIYTNLTGGNDVTSEVLSHINQYDSTYGNTGYNIPQNNQTYNL